jgi:hypothetical protein
MRILPTILALASCAASTDSADTTDQPTTYPLIAIYPDTIEAPVHLPCTVLLCNAGQCSPSFEYSVSTTGFLTVTPPDPYSAQVWCIE